MPRIGDERYILEMIDNDRYEALARKRGWDGGEGMLDYAEHFEAAVCTEHAALDAATDAARKWLALGKSTFGCCMIYHQVFERFEDDMHPEWEEHHQYEVAMDGERIECG